MNNKEEFKIFFENYPSRFETWIICWNYYNNQNKIMETNWNFNKINKKKINEDHPVNILKVKIYLKLFEVN